MCCSLSGFLWIPRFFMHGWRVYRYQESDSEIWRCTKRIQVTRDWIHRGSHWSCIQRLETREDRVYQYAVPRHCIEGFKCSLYSISEFVWFHTIYPYILWRSGINLCVKTSKIFFLVFNRKCSLKGVFLSKS